MAVLQSYQAPFCNTTSWGEKNPLCATVVHISVFVNVTRYSEKKNANVFLNKNPIDFCSIKAYWEYKFSV